MTDVEPARVEHTDVAAYALGLLEEPERSASSFTISCAWRFVPTMRSMPPRATVSWMKLNARWKRRAV